MPCGCGARGRSHPRERARATIPTMFERTALPAGPRVISARLPGARSVSIAAYVLAGSRLETPAETGVAHFMEHLTFKGTARYPTTRAISEAIEGVGGLVQRRDRPRIDRLLGPRPAARGRAGDGRPRRADRPAASDRRRHRQERTVIVEEIRSYLDDPSEYCQILFQTALFGDGPLGREICGDEAGIRALPRPRSATSGERCTGRRTRSSRSSATSATTSGGPGRGGVRDRQRGRPGAPPAPRSRPAREC